MLTKDDLIELGFKEIPHFTVGRNLTYDLGRNKELSMCYIGTCSELLWLTEQNPLYKTDITDCINLHNYDYDGFITIEKLKDYIRVISTVNKGHDAIMSK